MSNSFNIKRFGLLFKKYTVENVRTYLLSLIVLMGIFITLIGLMTEMGTVRLSIETQVLTFTFFILLAGTIFTSNIFSNLSDKRKAIATLMLPASAFEKFLVGWVYSYLFFQIIFTGIFYVVLWLFLNIRIHSPMMNLFSTKQNVYVAFLLYAFLHAVFIYGAIYFKKAHFIKTAFVLFMLILIIWVTNDIILSNMVHHHIATPPFTYLSFNDDHGYYRINVNASSYFIEGASAILIACLIWTATFFRLKEKQI
jgi:hypothetical protein